MADLVLRDIHVSPFSERVRWVLEQEGLPYARRPYQPLADEADLKSTTGIATAPVLLADGAVVGDSDAAVEWAEAAKPTPPLMPADPRQRAAVRALELTATEVLGPAARLVMVGRWQAAGFQPLGDYFANKYHWSPEAEARGVATLKRTLPDLARAVQAGRYLVGDGFTRADLTLASMLTPVLGPPPDELFALEAPLRQIFAPVLADDPATATLTAWRDDTYRRHRGGRVTQPA